MTTMDIKLKFYADNASLIKTTQQNFKMNRSFIVSGEVINLVEFIRELRGLKVLFYTSLLKSFQSIN